MTDVFPHALFVSRRGLCPGCGAPVPLEGQGPFIACPYCGTRSRVERRLRTNEPEIPLEEKARETWTPSHLLPGDESERAACGACGGDLSFKGEMALVTCGGCGSVSKVERRLERVDEVAIEAGEDPATVALLDRLRTSTDLAERVTLAKTAFDGWSYVNDTMAGRIDEILALLETADPRLAHAAGEIVGKLLCDGKPLYRAAVLAAAERRLFHRNVSRVLLWQLGLGPGLCLKRLLDAADVLWKNGDLVRASTALWAANTLLGRNYPDHPTLAQVVLYRLLYLHGPVLGWALRFAQGQGGVGYRYPAPVLIQFIDDCALERPTLVPEIERAFHDTSIENATDYEARLDLYARLVTPEARAALLRTLPPPPRGTGLRVVQAAHEVLVAALSDPALAAAATTALVRPMKEGVPAAIHALVKARGDALPEELRRAYLEKVKTSPHLAPLPPRSWQPETPAPRAPELEDAARLYEDGIRRAVDLWNAEAEALRRYGAIIADRSPLMVAAGRGDLGEIERLVKKSDVNATNAHGRTALMFAAENGHAAAIRALGADPSLRDRDGKTAIALAAEAGHVEAVRALIGIPSLDQEAFLEAFAAEKLDAVRVLLEAGADPDALEADGSTPLMACAKRGQVDLARLLLDAHAQLDHADDSGKSALLHAAEAGHVALVEHLVERGASVDLATPEQDTALVLAARAGHAAVVAFLASRVADVNAPGAGGKSALAWAEERGHAAVASVLASRGASLAGDAVLLVEAVEKRDLARVRALLDAGVSPDARDASGRSVLERSLSKSKPEIFRLLLERGAKPDAAILHRLVVLSWIEAIEPVLARGLDVDARDARGETALMVAAMKGAVEIARLLLAHGADRHARDARGADVVGFARMRAGNDEMLRLLGG